MPNAVADTDAPQPSDLGRRLVEVLWADGEETAWDADLLMQIGEVLDQPTPGEEHSTLYAVARPTRRAQRSARLPKKPAFTKNGRIRPLCLVHA